MRFARTFGCLVAAAATVFSTPAAAQTTLKFASFEPPQAPITGSVFIPWAEEVTKASGGSLKIDVFPGGVLGRNPLQQLKLVQDGVADLTWTVPGYTPGRFDDTEVAELPFLVTSSAAGSLAMSRLHAKGMLSGFDEIKLLLIGTVPPNAVHSRSPVRSLADLKGKRIRAGSSQIAKLIEAHGAVPVQRGATQVAESLSRGVIDATLNEWNFVGTFKIDEVVSHHLVVPMGTVAVMVPMMKARYDALPPAAKAALDRYSGEALARRFGAVVDKSNDATRERVSHSGKNTVATLPPAEEQAWRKATQPVIDAWRTAKPKNAQLYDAFKAELAAAGR